jgi:predicted ATP-grasp superfamily ATP-dependent carboligase
MKVGRYPLHHGTVAAIRSLGRLGVPVYAVTEDRLAPAGLSRYLTGSFRWPTTGAEPASALLAGLRGVGSRLGQPAVALATDDEAAILLAEHRRDLADLFLLPAVDPTLPGRLADKRDLYELCGKYGAPAPRTEMVDCGADLVEAANRIGLPIVAKNPAPWVRLLEPIVGSTTRLSTEADVAALAETLDRRGGRILVQEYLPVPPGSPPGAMDWFAHTYSFRDDRPPLVFTGIKLRSWPPGGGVTARGIAVADAKLAAVTADFCRAIGYRGIADLDWRLDPRDGQFKLVDFNPRTGAQFQLFRTTAGIDVVRALYLDLIGRRVPEGRQIDGRELIVEHLDAVSGLAGRLSGRAEPAHPRPRHREPAWFAWDDPLPFAVATARFAARFIRRAAAGAH